VQDVEAERQRLCQKYEREKEAKLDEVQAAEKRRQMLENEDIDVSTSNLLTVV